MPGEGGTFDPHGEFGHAGKDHQVAQRGILHGRRRLASQQVMEALVEGRRLGAALAASSGLSAWLARVAVVLMTFMTDPLFGHGASQATWTRVAS
jgi:hypothetical protein